MNPARTLHELALLCRADLLGAGARPVHGIARLDEAGPDEVSFLTQAQYRAHLATTRAAAVIVGRGVATDRADLTLLVCDDPEDAVDVVARAFAPVTPAPEPGVHATAVVDPGAAIASSASIGALCVVGPGARVEEGAVLLPRVTLGADVRVGARTLLHPGVVVYPHCTLGVDCIVHSGAVIGSDGFGFRHTSAGWTKTPQVGRVEIGDGVEIGANSAIDRGRFGATRIGAGTKIDNLVHVAHNVTLGDDCLLIAQSGIAGSTRLGRGVILAGQAGIAGHLDIAAGTRIGAGAGVLQDLPGGDWFGYPARPSTRSHRLEQELERLPEVRQRVRALERKLDMRSESPATGADE